MYNILKLIGSPEVLVLGGLIALIYILRRGKSSLTPLVIRTWRALDVADQEGCYVVILGRAAGITAWLGSIVSLDLTVSMKVNSERIEFAITSLSGYEMKFIPLCNVCSTICGYSKPWKKALLIFFAVFFPTYIILMTIDQDVRGSGSISALALGLLLSLAAAVAYYLLNRSFTIGFVEDSGERSIICFKRSVLENQEIDEVQAGYVSQLIQALIEHKQKNSTVVRQQELKPAEMSDSSI